MLVEQRIRISILIEKMNENKKYCERLGLENVSRFHGERVQKGEHERC